MAVYTHLGEPELRTLIEGEYDLGEFVSARGIESGVSNSNYRIHTARGPHILTIYESRTNPADLPFFLGLMEHVASQGVACPKPLPRRDGAHWGQVAGKCAAIVSFLPGESRDTTTAADTREAGRALAALHLAGAGFTPTRANALGLEGWQGLFAALSGRLDTIHPRLDAEIAAELAWLAAHWPHALAPRGVIHADFFPDNVFFSGGAVSGIIDFYFACNDALAYDLAIAINAWCFTRDGAFDDIKAAAMVSGYQSLRPLTDAERAAMPVLLRGAAMRFLMTRCYDWINRKEGALVKPHDPMHYVRILQFHQAGKWRIA